MTSSPRLLALATLLAPVILFLVVHTAHGATRPTVRFTSAPAAVTATRTASLGAWTRSRPWRRRRWTAEWTALPASTVTHGGALDPAPASGVASYRSRISTDGGTTWSAGPAADVTVTAEGETLVQFAAVDRAGNASPWSSSAVVRLDRTTPGVPTVSGAPDGWTNAAAVQLSIAGSGAVEHQRSLDGGASWDAPGSGNQVDVTEEGETLVRARTCDQAGNCSEWSQPLTVRIDRTAPSAPAGVTGGDGGDPSRLYQETQQVTFTALAATDPGSGSTTMYRS